MNIEFKLTKICISCGIEKPLTAFLQFSGKQPSYGNICSACRKTDLENPHQKDEGYDSLREEYKLSIDAKAKTQMEHDKIAHQLEHEEIEKKDREKAESLKQNVIDKKTNKAKEERNHRETFLEKRSFLATPAKPSTGITDNTPAATAQKETVYETTNAFTDTYIPKLKYTTSPEFKKIQALFGPGAAISKLVETATPALQNKSDNNTVKQNKDNTTSTDLKKPWEPNSTRRR